MALFRVLNCNFLKNLSSKCVQKSPDMRLAASSGHFFSQERSFFGKGYGRKLRVMKLRRKLAGPERIRRRSEWSDWNYKAELYAFNRRLYENISEDTLRCAFTHDSYIRCEELKRKELDVPLQDVPLDIKSNSPLINRGREVTSNFCKRYLRHCFQYLPEEGIVALHDYLLSDKVLGHVSFNLGTKDLILSEEYPPEEDTLSKTLLAIIGGIVVDDSVARAEKFVLDFICMQLIGKDVFEIWDLQDPTNVLNDILQKHGMSKYEPRLIFESGRNTIESIYHVGLYSDKIFLGRAPGETLNIAEELAAYDCLRKIFKIREAEKPFSSEKISIENLVQYDSSNPRVEEWYSETLKSQKCF